MILAAFLDANVLYSATIRSVLKYLAIEDLFRPRWSAAVPGRWIRALLNDRPGINPRRIDRTRALVDANIPDAIVSGYESLVPTLVHEAYETSALPLSYSALWLSNSRLWLPVLDSHHEGATSHRLLSLALK